MEITEKELLEFKSAVNNFVFAQTVLENSVIAFKALSEHNEDLKPTYELLYKELEKMNHVGTITTVAAVLAIVSEKLTNKPNN